MESRRLILSVILAFLIVAHPAGAQSVQGSAPRLSAGKAMTVGIASVAIPTTIGLINIEDSSAFGWPFLLTAWIMGPAPGLFYARNEERAWDGMAFRTLTLGIAAGGVAIMAANFELFGGGNDNGVAAGALIGFAATALTIGSWIKDLSEIRPSVEQYNQGLQATPLLTADGRVGAQFTYRW